MWKVELKEVGTRRLIGSERLIGSDCDHNEKTSDFKSELEGNGNSESGIFAG